MLGTWSQDAACLRTGDVNSPRRRSNVIARRGLATVNGGRVAPQELIICSGHKSAASEDDEICSRN